MNASPAGTPSPQRPNLLLIDLLRGAAALAVVLYHGGAVAFFPRDAAPFFHGDPFANSVWLGTAVSCCVLAAIGMYWLIERPSHHLARSGYFRVGTRRESFGVGYAASSIILVLMVGVTGWTSILVNRQIISFPEPPNQAFFQVPSEGVKSISIKGTAGVIAEKIEWCSARVDSPVLRDTIWRPLDTPNLLTGGYSGTIQLGPGKHVIWLRSRSAGKTWLSPPKEVFIGDLFLVMGQSNALGQSSEPMPCENEHVRLIDGIARTSRIANDPQTPEGGGSPWPASGDDLQRHLGYPVGFVNIAKGGLSIRQISSGYWLDLHTSPKRLGGNQVKGILWCQGESDGSMSGSEYGELLDQIIDYSISRRLFVGEPNWIISVTSWDGERSHDPIRLAQKSLIASNRHAHPGPDTDRIQGSGRDADGVHFSRSGNLTLAKEWSSSMIRSFSGPTTQTDR